jgi:enamine deaminase RidA (YjgF/YER057c/UK114 family)
MGFQVMNVITVNQQSNRARVGSDIVLVNGWGITSGLGPVELENDRAALPEGIERQTAKILSNLEILLKAAGLGRENVVAVRIYLVDAARLLERLNAAYVGFFAAERLPARTVIGVNHLTRGSQVEMDFVLCSQV